MTALDDAMHAATRRAAEQILADARAMRPRTFVYRQPPLEATEITADAEPVYTITTLPERPGGTA